jgi:regulatory protein
LIESDDARRALELAYRALGAGERTEHELRLFLAKRRVEPAQIAAAVEEMATIGLLDDAGYAKRFAQDRRLLDQWGSERIGRDLARRGVQRELIEGALAGVGQAEELATAVDLLNRRFPMPLADDRDRDRAWRLLVRRGYEAEVAYTAVRAHERGAVGRAAA